MAFTLQVEFTGLCLYLEHQNGQEVAVLQPDCRPDPSIPNYMVHEDETRGIPHVGYLRFDLANLDAAINGNPTLPVGTTDGPRYEVIHRFRRQHLDFGIAVGDSVTGTLELPRFERIANERDAHGGLVPLLEPREHLFSTSPGLVPRELLMRTILRGGELSAVGRETWQFPRWFSRGDPGRYVDDFRSSATWTRHFADATTGLTIKLSDFDGGNLIEIPLKAIGGVITLKIANLCAVNPLEWEPLGIREVTDDDHDFKWLYRLLQPTQQRTYRDLLLDVTFPIPTRPSDGGAGVEDCFGGVLKVPRF